MKFLKTKYLTPIALLIFFMPFLRMCGSRVEVVEAAAAIDTISAKVVDSANTKIDFSKENDEFEDTNSVNEEQNKDVKRTYKEINAYELGTLLFRPIFEEGFQLNDLKEMSLKDFKDKEIYALGSYTLIILFSILMIHFSWRRKFLGVRNLAIVNIILIIISTILFINSLFLDEFEDIRYGMYVFIIYSILIIYISNKENLELKNAKS